MAKPVQVGSAVIDVKPRCLRCGTWVQADEICPRCREFFRELSARVLKRNKNL